MAALIDTNVLLRLVQPMNADSHLARNTLDKLRRSDQKLVIATQNLIEFWAVATRPAANNGFGMNIERAKREIGDFKSILEVLPETDQILPEWERLVVTYQVSGKNAHDARLVAVMNVNRIERILTFNV